MIVASTSVPHNGTRFLIRSLLPSAGIEAIHLHCEDENMPKLTELSQEYPLVIPVRHPREVALSWKKKGYDIGLMFGLYRNMFSFENPFYFPIDGRERDAHLNALGEFLGVELQTDWERVGEDDRPAIPLDAAEEEILSALFEEHDFSWW